MLVGNVEREVMHERVILWTDGGSCYGILTPDHDIYVEQLSGDQVEEVHAFQANGALPRGLALPAYRLRFALSRTEMRGALLLGRAEVASTHPRRALLRPTHVLWRRRLEVQHRFCESGCAYHGVTDFVTNTLMKVQHVTVSENSVHNYCVPRTVIWTWRFVLSRKTSRNLRHGWRSNVL